MRLIAGLLHDHVRSDPPCTVMDVSGARGSLGCETRPLYPPLPTRSRNSIVGGGSRCRVAGLADRRAIGASSAAEQTNMSHMRRKRNKIRNEKILCNVDCANGAVNPIPQ